MAKVFCLAFAALDCDVRVSKPPKRSENTAFIYGNAQGDITRLIPRLPPPQSGFEDKYHEKH
jgi:hypothetical protein